MSYEKMTDDDFDSILCRLIDEYYAKSPSSLLQIPGIYDILAEHFNNEVLDTWEYQRDMEEAEHDQEE